MKIKFHDYHKSGVSTAGFNAKRLALFTLALFGLILLNCSELPPYKEETPPELFQLFGWLADEENPLNIPLDITPFGNDTTALPPWIMMENKYPPIGDQGNFGTCIAWAVGYNMKTALNGIERNWSSADLARAENQISPADLWKTIPHQNKTGCMGTKFESALDAMLSSGVRAMSAAPYSDAFCSEASGGDARNKISNYRRIAYNGQLSGGGAAQGMSAANFKGYLAQGRPIAFGAKLGDKFMDWKSGEVLAYDTYDKPATMHARHAMVLSGYDDSKRAFRVRNSWGTAWGDGGSIWIDYDFFVNEFCIVAFVAQNPVTVPENIHVPSFGYDLLASYAEDYPDPRSENPRARLFTYDVYNIGNRPILAGQRWSVLYFYYNAYNANDIGVIYEDYYTDEFGAPLDSGAYNSPTAIAGGWWQNVSVMPGKKASETEYEDGFVCEYIMPEITGEYYLVVFADAYNVIDETNEDNNFFFITAEGGKPLRFDNGVLLSGTASMGKRRNAHTAPATPAARLEKANMYTPQEIMTALQQHKQNGTLEKELAKYRTNRSTNGRRGKRSR